MPDRQQQSSDLLKLAMELGEIKKGQEVIITTLSEDRIASATYRTQMREQLRVMGEGLVKTNTDLVHATNSIRELKEDIKTDIRPSVQAVAAKVVRAEGMSEGAQKLAVVLDKVFHLVWVAVGGAIFYFYQLISTNHTK